MFYLETIDLVEKMMKERKKKRIQKNMDQTIKNNRCFFNYYIAP